MNLSTESIFISSLDVFPNVRKYAEQIDEKNSSNIFEKRSLYFVVKVILMEFRFTLQGPFHSLGSGQDVNMW